MPEEDGKDIFGSLQNYEVYLCFLVISVYIGANI